MRDIKRLVDPDLLLNPGVVLPVEGSSAVNRRPHAQAAGHRRVRGRPLRRVRLLRARLPVQGHHAHAAPADHGAPRHGGAARRRGHVQPRTSWRGLRVRRHRHVRRRRDVRAGVPGGDQHRRPGPAPASRGREPRSLRATGMWLPAPGAPVARRRVCPPGGRRVAGLVGRVTTVAPQGGQHRRDAAVRRHAARRGSPRVPGKVGAGTPQAVYVPACIQTMFGPEAGDGVMAAFREVCERAGVTIEVPVASAACAAGRRGSRRGTRPATSG